MSNISRAIIDALLPPGSLWVPMVDEGLDLLFSGMAENHESVSGFLKGLGSIRNPQKTPILSDLEREFGIEPNTALTDQQRRDRLQSVKTDKSGDGTAYRIEQKLRESGFDVYVHINNPAVDPSQFVLNEWYTVCGHEDAVCGYENALCGVVKDMLIVNGNIFFDHETMPEDSNYWPLIFFVGGPATRNVYGRITDIDDASVPIERSDEFLRLIVKYKPMHSWAGVVANFI